jgi:hypothetical protein
MNGSHPAVRSPSQQDPLCEPTRVPVPRCPGHEPQPPASDRREPPRADSQAHEVGWSVKDVDEVALWTSKDGYWGEHATFLLHTRDDHWHAVELSDPAANTVVAELSRLPKFDKDELLALIGQRERKIVTLWRSSPLS